MANTESDLIASDSSVRVRMSLPARNALTVKACELPVGLTAMVDAPIAHIPLHMRAGSIVPMG